MMARGLGGLLRTAWTREQDPRSSRDKDEKFIALADRLELVRGIQKSGNIRSSIAYGVRLEILTFEVLPQKQGSRNVL